MLIAFSGLKGSGKDTAAKVLISEYGFTKVAFADAVRELALIIDPWIPTHYYGMIRLSELIADAGWDWAKRNISEVRKLLQVIGTEAGRNFFHEDVWIEILNKQFPGLSWDDTRYVITDCRFENEVEFVHEKHGSICWIDRPEVTSDGHASESVAIRDKVDYILNNNSSIAQLEEDVRLLLFMKGIDPIEPRTTD